MTMLLSRTAEQIFWLGRHLERLEGTARIVREHSSLVIDLPVEIDSDWSALLAICGVDEPFDEEHEIRDESSVVRFLLSSHSNPGSARSTLDAARENLRVSRSSFPSEIWFALNQMRVDLRVDFERCGSRTVRIGVCDRVIRTCQQIAGAIAGTMRHDTAMCFLEVGRLIERADLATRVLDVRATALMANATGAQSPADRGPYEDIRWLGVLRSLDAQEMYRRASSVGVDGSRVADFVLDDDSFPRSVRFCLQEMASVIDRLPGRPEMLATHQRVLGVLDGRTRGSRDAGGLHEFLDGMQAALASLHDVVAAAYFHPEPVMADAS